MTDCLNFGNPEKPEIYYQLEQAILGMSQACRALGVPVVSGNVSLYNETDGEPIYPTPMVGALGKIDDASAARRRRLRDGLATRSSCSARPSRGSAAAGGTCTTATSSSTRTAT